jgi:hypothetical protein
MADEISQVEGRLQPHSTLPERISNCPETRSARWRRWDFWCLGTGSLTGFLFLRPCLSLEALQQSIGREKERALSQISAWLHPHCSFLRG